MVIMVTVEMTTTTTTLIIIWVAYALKRTVMPGVLDTLSLVGVKNSDSYAHTLYFCAESGLSSCVVLPTHV